MRTLLSIVLLLAPYQARESQAAKPEPTPPKSSVEGAVWKITFADDFDGTAIDPQRWNIVHEDRTCRVNNFWHRDCAQLSGKGQLRMITRKSLVKPGWHDTLLHRN